MDFIFADIAIALSTLTLLVALGATACSVIRSMRVSQRPKSENGVPTRLITLGVAALVLATAIPSLLIGSLTDMCIITAIVLLAVASAAVITGRILTARLRKRV